ncbi:hypothetical protein J7L29_05925 [Candidatus Bathyarchaeota archaeon]|nr:hypothetical protein [Candidatus Bathyarchaeota archaeon]
MAAGFDVGFLFWLFLLLMIFLWPQYRLKALQGARLSLIKNWLEELVAEWPSLQGYLVETNVRLKAGKGGGVDEADVIGVKLEGSTLHIKHIGCSIQVPKT